MTNRSIWFDTVSDHLIKESIDLVQRHHFGENFLSLILSPHPLRRKFWLRFTFPLVTTSIYCIPPHGQNVNFLSNVINITHYILNAVWYDCYLQLRLVDRKPLYLDHRFSCNAEGKLCIREVVSPFLQNAEDYPTACHCFML